MLSWPGGTAGRPHVSFADVYDDFSRQKKKRDPNEFRDKIVVIGVTASGLHDIRSTPVKTLYDGIDILAGTIDNLKNGNYLRPAPGAWPVAIALAMLVFLYAGFRAQLHTLKIGGALLAATFVLVTVQYVAIGKLLVLPMLRPLCSPGYSFSSPPCRTICANGAAASRQSGNSRASSIRMSSRN